MVDGRSRGSLRAPLLPSPFSLLPSPFSLLPSPFSLLPSPFSLPATSFVAPPAPACRKVPQCVALPSLLPCLSSWLPVPRPRQPPRQRPWAAAAAAPQRSTRR